MKLVNEKEKEIKINKLEIKNDSLKKSIEGSNTSSLYKTKQENQIKRNI